MIKRMRQFFEASSKTKYFALNWIVYGAALIITTLYCYARLDYVRSGPPSKKQHEDTRKP